ncbi:terpene synthase family protein [Streptomyces sp. NPDC050636]|uniref:terpene synthase family protein n=1 Tax=Streptomyces sp. NPDC050636 TaxID=3154510 RepID=UPI00343CB4C7
MQSAKLSAALRPEECSYRLPEMTLILPVTVHPMLPQVQYDLPCWVRSYITDVAGMDLEEWLNTGFELWTCHAYPHAREDRLLRMTRYAVAVTVADDETTRKNAPFGGSSAYAKAAVRVWEDMLHGRQATPAEAPAWWQLMGDAWNDLCQDMSDGLRERFLADQCRILRRSVTEVEIREQGNELELEDYMDLRRDTIYGAVCWHLAEYGLGIDLTEEFSRHPDELGAVWQDANDHLIVVNDLFSFRKEWFVEQDTSLNASSILRRNKGLTVQQLVNRYADRAAELERSYVQKCVEITTTSWGNTPRMHAYLREIGHIMAATLHFSRFTSRYHAVGFLWNGITDATVTMLPERTLISPNHRTRPNYRTPYLYRSPFTSADGS